MDIVYTFKYDRRAWTDQLIYSLRSVEKHFSGVDNIFVVGDNPKLKGVIHIPATDVFSPAKNIILKISKAVADDRISEDFLYMADDHYISRDMKVADYPYYVNGSLTELLSTQKIGYGQIIKNTIKALAPKGSERNFNVHCPIIYNKKRFSELDSMYNMGAPLGYLIKSLYMNTFQFYYRHTPFIETKDCKIRTNFQPSDIARRIAGRDCWSSGKENQCSNIQKFLKEMYPLKSKYE